MERFEGKATLASTIAEVGENCDVVGICVQNDEQVLQCVEPLLPTMNPGSVLLIHSTIRPATAQAIAHRAAARGLATTAAPVPRLAMGKDGPFDFGRLGGDTAVKAWV